MRRTALLACGAAIAVFATTAQGQAKVKEFDGKWTRVEDPNAPPPAPPAGGGDARGGGGGGGRGGGRGGGLGMEVRIEVDASNNKFYIIRTTQAGETKSTYNLDGTESKNTTQGRGGAMEQTSKTKWSSDTLAITTSMMMGENNVETSMALWIDKSGNLMVRSTGQGRGGNPPTPVVVTYKKN